MTKPTKPKIDYIVLSTKVLSLKIPDKAKMILALVLGFHPKPLMMDNESLADLLMTSTTYISRMITLLSNKKLVRITGKQSRYRKIYFEQKCKVNRNLLCTIVEFTLNNSSNKRKGNKEDTLPSLPKDKPTPIPDYEPTAEEALRMLREGA